MLNEIRPALVLVVVLTLITGLVYPLAMTGIAGLIFPASGARQPDREGRQGRRLGADRPGVHRATAISTAGRRRPPRPTRTIRPRRCQRPTTPRTPAGSNLGPTNKALIERVKGDVGQAEGGEPVGSRSDRPRDHIGQRPRSAHLAGGGAVPGAAGRQGAQSAGGRVCASSSTRHIEGRLLGLLGEPRVNVLALNLALDRHGAR